MNQEDIAIPQVVIGGATARFVAPALTYDLANGNRSELVFERRSLERGFRAQASDQWSADVQTLEDLARLTDGSIVHDAWSKDRETVILDLATSIAWVSLHRYAGSTSSVNVSVRAPRRAEARLAIALVRELLPERIEESKDSIPVIFWYQGGRGPRQVNRELPAPAWSDSCANYPRQTADALAPLMADLGSVMQGGRLLLWHGAPGTGKTSALRALGRENAESVRLEYVLDPEGFFGRDAAYAVGILFDEDEDEEGRTRLLILEDCDELLAADARNRGGQGLARLLNMVDGLIGQGLDLGVLITTNEALIGLHPAAMRPGRCGANVDFRLFDREGGQAWLARNGSQAVAPPRASLADLRALLEGRELQAPPEPIGFRVP